MHYYFLANPLAENWRMNAYENRIFGNASIPLSNPLFLPKDFCRLRIQFPDSSSLFFSLMLQTNSIWVTVSKTKETNCISSTGSGNPKRFIKNWLGSISQCHNVWKLLKMSSIDLSGNTVWPQTSKCRIWNIQFWHFPPIFVLLKLTCLVTLFFKN